MPVSSPLFWIADSQCQFKNRERIGQVAAMCFFAYSGGMRGPSQITVCGIFTAPADALMHPLIRRRFSLSTARDTARPGTEYTRIYKKSHAIGHSSTHTHRDVNPDAFFVRISTTKAAFTIFLIAKAASFFSLLVFFVRC